MIPEETVEQVVAAADIVAIIGEHVKLKKTGSVWRGPCPFHQGTNANFSVVPGRGYKCFVCGESGTVFTFVQKRLGMSFPEAVKYVGAKSGIEVQEVQRSREGPDPREPLWELHGTVAEYFQRQLWDAPAGAEARAYLASRDVSRETAERFGLGYAPRELTALREHLRGLGVPEDRAIAAGILVQREDGDELRPRFRDRLMFPILEQGGKVVGFGGRLLGPGEPKYLNSAESEIFSKGKLLYNLGSARNAIRREDRVIVVEGYFDALRLVDAGVEHVVAPMGTALGEGQADLLARFTKHAVLLYDSDGPGQKATFRAADVLLAKGFEVRTVTLPEGEDPDTFVRSKGRAGIAPLIDQAMDIFDRKVQLLQRAGWFNDLQHKRRALDRLLPTIRAASDPITRDLYLARAAEAAGIAREVLLQELHAVRRGTRAAAAPVAAASPNVAPVQETFRGPYRSPVVQGAAEQTLLRVMLTQPVWQDLIVEELGKLEMEELPEGADGDAFAEEHGGVLRDPVYAALYASVLRHGADADPELFTSGLDARAIYVYETLRGEADAVVDAKRSVADAMRQLRGRSVDARIAELQSILPLADEAEKDAIIGRINTLTEEKRALGVPRWGAVRR